MGGWRMANAGNIDLKTVEGFGEEWATFDQSALSQAELYRMFGWYFKVFPWDDLPPDATGFDLGCGSGRWARCVAPRVGTLHCIDPSEAALQVAKKNLEQQPNCMFHLAGVGDIPLPNGSMDFGYALGVLHHVPDTAAGIKECVAKLRPGAPFLVYLYYAFDNRPAWFRALWKASDTLRRVVSRLSYRPKYWISSVIALLVYWPMARAARALEKRGANVDAMPLSAYRQRSFYSMRTDAFDRFATRLEQRFSAKQIRDMMQQAGLERVTFSPSMPYWCAVGYKHKQANGN